MKDSLEPTSMPCESKASTEETSIRLVGITDSSSDCSLRVFQPVIITDGVSLMVDGDNQGLLEVKNPETKAQIDSQMVYEVAPFSFGQILTINGRSFVLMPSYSIFIRPPAYRVERRVDDTSPSESKQIHGVSKNPRQFANPWLQDVSDEILDRERATTSLEKSPGSDNEKPIEFTNQVSATPVKRRVRFTRILTITMGMMLAAGAALVFLVPDMADKPIEPSLVNGKESRQAEVSATLPENSSVAIKPEIPSPESQVLLKESPVLDQEQGSTLPGKEVDNLNSDATLSNASQTKEAQLVDSGPKKKAVAKKTPHVQRKSASKISKLSELQLKKVTEQIESYRLEASFNPEGVRAKLLALAKENASDNSVQTKIKRVLKTLGE